MLTGHALFQARDLQHAATVVRTSKVPPLSEHDVKAPRELEAHLRRLLSVDPAQRPASAAETRSLFASVSGVKAANADNLAAYLTSIGIAPPSDEETKRADVGASSSPSPVGPPTMRAPDLESTRRDRRTQKLDEERSDGVPTPLDDTVPTDVDSPAPVPGSGRTFRMWSPQRPIAQPAVTPRSNVDESVPDRTDTNAAVPVGEHADDSTPRPRRKVLLASVAALCVVGIAVLASIVVSKSSASRSTPAEERPAATVQPADKVRKLYQATPIQAEEPSVPVRATVETPRVAQPPPTVDGGASATPVETTPARVDARTSEPTRRSRGAGRSNGKPAEATNPTTTTNPTNTDEDFKAPWAQ
jgi:hypothetical protein